MRKINPTLFYACLMLASYTFFVISCTNPTSADEDNDMGDPDIPEATITMDNIGAQSYTVTSVEGEGAGADQNTANPDITLTIGGRYTFVNDAGASSHPLDFRDADREKLFGQSNQSGTFDDDDAVELAKSGNSISFTLTNELAAELNDYICSFHPGMLGNVIVRED